MTNHGLSINTETGNVAFFFYSIITSEKRLLLITNNPIRLWICLRYIDRMEGNWFDLERKFQQKIPAVVFKEFQGGPVWWNADKRTILPDRVQSPAVVWRHSESAGRCERLAAPAGGRANGRLPPEPDPSAGAPAWWSRGSPRTPADCLSPTRAHGEARKGSATRNGGKGVKTSHESERLIPTCMCV